MAKKFKKLLGLERVFWDSKNEIKSAPVIAESHDGTIFCWEEEMETPVPFKRDDFGKLFFASKEESLIAAIARLEKYAEECQEEAELFKTML